MKEREMKANWAGGLTGAALFLCACASFADTYTGKLDLIEVKADGTRFFVQHEKLHLYASGAFKDALVAGYFRKAAFTVSYQPFPCGGSMSGKCGTVYSVAVEQAGF
jgi:hypothetical protein